MRIYTIIIMTLIALVSTGCSNSKMQIEAQQQLLISNEKSQIRITGKGLQKRSINLSALYVDQHTFSADDSSCLVFEDVQIADGYTFTFNDKQTIRRIFDADDVQKDESFGALTFYRLVLRDKKRSRLNVLVIMDTMYAIKLFYGFDDSVYMMFKQGLKQDNAVLEYMVDTSENHGACVQNSWPDSLVIIDPLVRVDD